MARRFASQEVATVAAPPPPTKAEENHQSRAIKSMIMAAQDRLMAVLPKHLTAERMAQVVTTLVYKTPKLQECPPATILSSVLEACELGLELSPKLGEAYLVPFWNKEAGGLICTMMPGYQGLVKLARNSGKVASIQARVVYAKDVFQIDYNPDLVFVHRPHLGIDRGPRVFVYAVAKLANGEHQIEVMNPDELEKVHRCSQGYQNAQRYNKAEVGPWVDWPEEQERKTVLKRLCKSLPRSIEQVRAIELDDRHYSLERVSPEPVRAQHGLSRSEMLARQLAGPAPEPEFEEGTSGAITTEAEEVPAGADNDEFEEGVNC